ncbi:MAG: TrmH family RNA methyltransferase [Planctomycetota bacterium]
MSANETIRSRANPLLKRAGSVLAGQETGTLALEGDRLVDDALAAGVAFETILVAEDREDRAAALERSGKPVRRVEAGLLARVSGLSTSPGILALAVAPLPIDLGRFPIDERTLFLVAAGVADPGNLGALARSAEAFGARALLVARGGASPWSAKALRGSMGSLLRLPVSHGVAVEEIARALATRGVRQACAATRGGTPLPKFDWRGPIALWMGSETGSLPELARGFERVTIPMAGQVESLNVAVAASLLLHASGRVARSDRGG